MTKCKGLSLNPDPQSVKKDKCVAQPPVMLLSVFSSPSIAVFTAIRPKAVQLCYI